MFKRILIFILLSALSTAQALSTEDQSYFDAFTREKRNLTRTKEHHLVRFFPMIGLSTNLAHEIYFLLHEPEPPPDFFALGLKLKELSLLEDYFYMPETGPASPGPSGITNQEDLKYFQAFTKKPRDLKKIKEKHLIRFFSIIGIDEDLARPLYDLVHSSKSLITWPDISGLYQISKETLNELQKYFFLSSDPESDAFNALTIEEVIEQTMDEETADEDSYILELTEELRDNPLDLNTVSAEKLNRLPWLSTVQVIAVLAYRKKNGSFDDIQDLLKIPRIDPLTFSYIQPFLYISESGRTPEESSLKEPLSFSGKSSTRIVTSFPYPEEFFDQYAPSSFSFKERIELSASDMIKAGWVFERDIGEISLFDLNKYYVQASDLKILKTFIAGNYRLNFGQGLTLSYSGPAKGGTVYRIRNSGRDMSGDLTSYENKNYYGTALKLKTGPLSVYGFASWRLQDATLEDLPSLGDRVDDTADDDSDNIITSFDPDSDGLHRTGSEIAKKDVFQRNLYGGRVRADLYPQKGPFQHIDTGLTFYSTVFPYPVYKEWSQDRYYSFRGIKITGAGYDWNVTAGLMEFFGEISMSAYPDASEAYPYGTNSITSGWGGFSGLAFNSKLYKQTIGFRSYSKNFYSFDNSPFAENGNYQAETGFYFGQMLKPAKKTKLHSYIDIYSKDWRKYSEPYPTLGIESLFLLEQSLAKKLLFSAQIKTETKDMNISISDSLSGFFRVHNDWRYRFELKWSASKKAVWRVRYETSATRIPDLNITFTGHLIFGDLVYDFSHVSRLYIRAILFDGNSKAGIWEYENEIPSFMASNQFSGQGSRVYFLLRNELIPKKLFLYIKYGATFYFRKDSVSSSLLSEEKPSLSDTEAADLLFGSTKHDLRVELIRKF